MQAVSGHVIELIDIDGGLFVVDDVEYVFVDVVRAGVLVIPFDEVLDEPHVLLLEADVVLVD